MTKRGFTAFFAILISSLALSVGLAIYDLLIRELALSQTATQSEYAIFAADSGAECALYWDAKAPVLNGSPSVFGTSTESSWGASPINCNAQNITVQGPSSADLSNYQGPGFNCTSSSSWCIAQDANAATTTFRLDFPPNPYCAIVQVAKSGDPSQTTVISHGFNTCANNGITRLERALQVSY
jgi:hypothetical protein